MLPQRDTIVANVIGGYTDDVHALGKHLPSILAEIEKEIGVVLTCTCHIGTCIYAGDYSGSEAVFHCWLTVNPSQVSNEKAREAYEAFAKKWAEKNKQQVVPIYFHTVTSSAAKQVKTTEQQSNL